MEGGRPRPAQCRPLSPGSNVLRSAPGRWPSPLFSSALGSLEPGPGLPVGQTDKVHGAPGCGGGVGQLAARGFGAGEWQQGDSLAGPAVAGEGVPLAVGVKATGLWVDFKAFSWAGSSSSRWRSSGFCCWVGAEAQPGWALCSGHHISVGQGWGERAVGTPGPGQVAAERQPAVPWVPAGCGRGGRYLELGGPLLLQGLSGSLLLLLLQGVELLLP